MPYFLVYSQTPVEKNDITITAASEWPSCQGSEFKWISTTYKPILWLFKKIKACKSRSLLTNQSAPIDKANLQMWDKGGHLQSPRCQLQHQKWQMTTPLTEFGEGHQGSIIFTRLFEGQHEGSDYEQSIYNLSDWWIDLYPWGVSLIYSCELRVMT